MTSMGSASNNTNQKTNLTMGSASGFSSDLMYGNSGAEYNSNQITNFEKSS